MTKEGGRCYRQFFLRSEMEWRRDNPPVYEPKPRKQREYDKSPTRDDCIYLAGFCDGEGSIYIRHRLDGQRAVFTLGIGISNTCLSILQWIHETFGGCLHEKRAGREDLLAAMNWQVCWLWQASAYEAATIIQLIRPYLRVKHRQADLAIEFQEHMRLQHRGRWHPATSADIEWRYAIKEKISALNGRQKAQKKYWL